MKTRNLHKFILASAVASLLPLLSYAESDHAHGEEENHSHDVEHVEDGLLKLTDEILRDAKIEMREAGPATLSLHLRVNGRLSPISANVAHIASRFSGVIRSVKKDIGETIAAGDLLATVESNQNLQIFEIRALKGGIITEQHATIGESIKEDDTLFIIMDLTQLWADFTVFQRDIGTVRVGQSIDIYLSGRAKPTGSQISFISPVVDETTQSRTARAVINNPDTILAPGAFATGQIAIARYDVPVAVAYEGIQTVDGEKVIFVNKAGGFEKRPISLGRSDGTSTEVLSGLKAGERYAATHSFILKAELEKSEAEHDH